ncbi:MAG: plastocyanin/azurin family copper-binding protein [Alphaproteobacteria bacterium]|jgi:pseudoazurin
MKKLLCFCVLFLLSINVPNAHSAEYSIEMLNKREDGQKMVYSQDIINIDVNDTVKWTPTSKGHNVEFITVPGSMDIPKKSKTSKEYSYTFDQPGVYLYQCTPHKSMGMIALVIVGKDTTNINEISASKVVGMSKKKLAKLIESIDS